MLKIILIMILFFLTGCDNLTTKYPTEINSSNKSNIEDNISEFIKLRKHYVEEAIAKFNKFDILLTELNEEDLKDYFEFGNYIFTELDENTNTSAIYYNYLKSNPQSIYLEEEVKEAYRKDLLFISKLVNDFNKKHINEHPNYIYFLYSKEFKDFLLNKMKAKDFQEYFVEMKYKLLNDIKINETFYFSNKNIWKEINDNKILDFKINDFYYDNFSFLTYDELEFNKYIFKTIIESKLRGLEETLYVKYLGASNYLRISKIIDESIKYANSKNVNNIDYFFINEVKSYNSKYTISDSEYYSLNKYGEVINEKIYPYNNIKLQKKVTDKQVSYELTYDFLNINNNSIYKEKRKQIFKNFDEAENYITRTFLSKKEFANIIKNAIKEKDLVKIYSLFNGELEGIPSRNEIKYLTFFEFEDSNWENEIINGDLNEVGYRGIFIGSGNIRFHREDTANGESRWSIKNIYGLKEPKIIIKHWNINNKIISPKCFSYDEGRYSLARSIDDVVGETYDLYINKFFITDLKDFADNPGKYFGREISSYNPIKVIADKDFNATSVDEDYYLVYKLDSCLINSDILSDNKLLLKEISNRNISGKASLYYNNITDVSTNICQKMAPYINGKCIEAKGIELTYNDGYQERYSEESFNTIYGLFIMNNGERLIFPLKNFNTKKELLRFINSF